ncbi:MAG: tRNA uridine-5-carboxymethylaminomethyl(34) synthesis GTPase MnmE [Bacteroidota bacterium]
MSIRNNFNPSDTICAISTPTGVGAISLIRISGKSAIETCGKIFESRKKIEFARIPSNYLCYGRIVFNNEIIDDVMLSIFRSPHSFTGEDMVEINCHGSLYIQKKILETLLLLGFRLASPGEFTLRAFLNKKLDLLQAEAIGDLIASTSKSAHDLAINQMRGGFSNKIKELREKLITFASLIELELDFSEEDVEFANRDEFIKLLLEIKTEIQKLKDSFAQGNVLKNGIPVAIVGKPNVGKSTLLNALLNEEKAIVSEIPGTTRDTIEDLLTLQGVTFRFIDTAGLRPSIDEIEQMGIERTYQKISQASIVLYVIDITQTGVEEIKEELADFAEHIQDSNKKFIIIGNKTDQLQKTPHGFPELVELETIFISAKRKENIQLIIESLIRSIQITDTTDNIIVSNIRHFEALSKTLLAIENMVLAIHNNIPTDLLTTDIRSAMHYLGEITGEITTEEIFETIFSRFCIGK